ncbi:MAG: hypothetical protein ACD_20C00207G0008 [uncultured bacterium]|nr:MAG: hypothetical protein ACD_20C00207G0008 [uncultured bacterium]HBH19142.1 cobalt chelatase [Cyanobacteria bacterium UBA9579]
MKRLRHYDKDLAVVLSVFGSSDDSAMEQYLQLQEEVKQKLPDDMDVRIAISSRTVLKKLEQKGQKYYTLPEQLANLDRLGHRKVIVSSVNVFPTEEHRYLERIVDAFRSISDRYEITVPLFTKSKKTNEFLDYLDSELRAKYNAANVIYVAHGAPNLNSSGSQSFAYARDYLKLLNPRNFFYTIEGSYPYKKEFFMQELEKLGPVDNTDTILVVPLLLVAGVHNKNDIQEIKEELSEKFDKVQIPTDFLSSGAFSLLKLQKTREYFVDEIANSINWLVCRCGNKEKL